MTDLSAAAQFPDGPILDLPDTLFAEATHYCSGGSEGMPLPIDDGQAHDKHTPLALGNVPGLDTHQGPSGGERWVLQRFEGKAALT